MHINFDIISDLHLTTIKDIDWQHKVTSLFCVVAGNVSDNHDVVFDFLNHISHLYKGVFYIDGELEHKHCDGDFVSSYESLHNHIEELDNVFFLHESMVVLEDVIITGTNGWTSFNFTDEMLIDSNINLLVHQNELTEETAKKIFKMAIGDQSYLRNSVATSGDIEGINHLLIVTNCVPRYEIIEQHADFRDSILGDLIGSLGIHRCLESYTKQTCWVFGRYPSETDITIDNVRYINNPACAKDRDIYYPRIIQL